MIRALVIIFLFIVISNVEANSQTLEFCQGVDNTGKAIKPGTVMGIDKNGGSVKALVKLQHRVGTQNVTFEIYKVGSDGSESYERTVNHNVQPDQTWFYKDISFKKDGVYNVLVYDGEGSRLISGRVTIQYY